MERLSEAKLKSLSKDALIMLIAGLWDQNDAIRAQLELSNEQLMSANKKLDALSEQILLMNQRSFGTKSEKSNLIPGQMVMDDVLIFNEAEVHSDDSPEPEIEEVIVSSFKRSKFKGQREADLSGLPARIIQHRLSDRELSEQFPEGYKELPEKIYRRLVVIPATFIVDEHHVHIYASKNNTGKIVRAKRPADVLRNSICTAELLSIILNSKYSAAVPLERMSAAFKSNGIKLETNTLANWVIKSSEYYFSLIYDELHKYLLQNRVIHADETPLQVRRDGRKASAKSYMWVYRGAELRGTYPIVLYDWCMTRKADNPREFLKGYCGTLVTDGYQAYHSIDNTWPDVTVAGCWIHARRDFAEFLKSANDDVAKNAVAKEAYDKISYIMHLDNQYDSLNKKDREYKRKHELKLVVDAFFAWAKDEHPKFDSEYKHSMVGIIALTIAAKKKVMIDNPPLVSDTFVFVAIINELGGNAHIANNKLYIDASEILSTDIPIFLSRCIHGSLYMCPALLVANKRFCFYGSGGCQIGDSLDKNKRPIAHIMSVMGEFGGEINIDESAVSGS